MTSETQKLISNLKKEIEKRYKEVRKDYQIYGEANNWDKKNIERATQKELEENDYTYQMLQAQLQFAEKLIKSIKEDVEDIFKDYENPEEETTISVLDYTIDKIKQKLNKLLNEAIKNGTKA